MDYKLSVFDTTAFKNELADMLYLALAEDELDELTTFIEHNIPVLHDPHTGQSLDSSWRKSLKPRMVNDFADIALTKYYDPAACTSVPGWLDLADFLRGIQDDLGGLILGSPFGPVENYFDPRQTGAYFQSPTEAKRTLAMLEMLSEQQHDEFAGNESLLSDMAAITTAFSHAVNAAKGVYITFA